MSFLQAKRKLDLEDPLYLPDFRSPKSKSNITARVPSPRSEYKTKVMCEGRGWTPDGS